MALFVPDVEFTIALVFIEYLRNCFPNVRNRVSFHMIYPGRHKASKQGNDMTEGLNPNTLTKYRKYKFTGQKNDFEIIIKSPFYILIPSIDDLMRGV